MNYRLNETGANFRDMFSESEDIFGSPSESQKKDFFNETQDQLLSTASSKPDEDDEKFPGIKSNLKRIDLRDIDFTDIYLDTDDPSNAIIRGLRKAGSFQGVREGLHKIPRGLIPVIQDFSARLVDSIESDEVMDLTINVQGRSYRCSRMAAPDPSWQKSIQRLSDVKTTWCVRSLGGSIPTLEALKIPPVYRRDLEGLHDERGLVVICGPFGSGKTTTASSVFDTWVRRRNEMGVTFEDPPEMPLARSTENEGTIFQFDMTDRSISEIVKRSRRWAPRYLYVGEVRSPDVCAEMLHLSISGPLCICTIHSSDPIHAIMSILRYGSDSVGKDMAHEILSSSLKLVLHQTIVNDKVFMRRANLRGAENALARSLIKTGQFHAMRECFDRQEINDRKILRSP